MVCNHVALSQSRKKAAINTAAIPDMCRRAESEGCQQQATEAKQARLRLTATGSVALVKPPWAPSHDPGAGALGRSADSGDALVACVYALFTGRLPATSTRERSIRVLDGLFSTTTLAMPAHPLLPLHPRSLRLGLLLLSSDGLQRSGSSSTSPAATLPVADASPQPHVPLSNPE